MYSLIQQYMAVSFMPWLLYLLGKSQFTDSGGAWLEPQPLWGRKKADVCARYRTTYSMTRKSEARKVFATFLCVV
jgi:hypothetical protein